MPLPDEALNVDGGCNCGAIRYRVAIPAVAERPLHPLAPLGAPVPMPFLALDHCNDCRRATASLLPAWLCALIEMCSVSLVVASAATLAPKADAREGQAEERRSPWTPATHIIVASALALVLQAVWHQRRLHCRYAGRLSRHAGYHVRLRRPPSP
jgi:hypothetical protein